jgi:hypothetical protein
MHNLYHRPESKQVIGRLRSKLEKWQQLVKDNVKV